MRPTLLIVGCGDVGLRVLKRLKGRWRVLALTSQPARAAELRAAGAVPLQGDLDRPQTLYRLAGLADAVMHLAPPPAQGRADPRTAALLRALATRGGARRLVYASTTGVYGHARGEWVDETRPVAPVNERAHRRVDAEARVREHARSTRGRAVLLRIPGIYAFDRPGGNPLERLVRRHPVLRPEDDVHTNRIHADDLARACVAALHRLMAGAPGVNLRAIHVADDSRERAGDHATELARLTGLPPPPRLSRAEAEATLSPMTLSFLSESRRLRTDRLRRDLKLRLQHPTVFEALQNDPAAGPAMREALQAAARLSPGSPQPTTP